MPNGAWNTDMLFAQFPYDIAIQILGYPLPNVVSLDDSYVCGHTSNGIYSTRSAYLEILKEKHDIDSPCVWF